MIARLVSSLYSGLFMVCKVDRVYDLGMFRISPFQGLTFRVAKTPQTKVHHFPKKTQDSWGATKKPRATWRSPAPKPSNIP